MENINPNNIKVGDTIEVQDAWEDEAGGRHDEFAEVMEIDKDGMMTLKFEGKDVDEYLLGADFFAKDYKPEAK